MTEKSDGINIGEFMSSHDLLANEFISYVTKDLSNRFEYTNINSRFNLSEFIISISNNDLNDVRLVKSYTNYDNHRNNYYISWLLLIKTNNCSEYDVIMSIVSDCDTMNLEDVIVSPNTIPIIYADQAPLENIIESISSFIKECERINKYNRIQYLNFSNNGHYFSDQQVLLPNIPDLDLYYGNGFKKIHNNIIAKLRSGDGSIFILHGEPGTGKTNYIRYIINECKDIDFVYLPASMIPDMHNANLMPVLRDMKNRVIIIEESENLVTDRKFDHDKSSIDSLLNIGDGLLSDGLNIKIILTFNTDIANIDKALRRPGRLAISHKFDRISSDNANKIAMNNKIDNEFTCDVTLATIFNNIDNDQQSKSIGF